MRQRRRHGFTLLELMVVLAAILVLGAVFLPSLAGFRTNTRIKAAADTVRGRMADARRRAMEDGQAYRVSLSTDSRRVRVAAETAETTGDPSRADGSGGTTFQTEQDLPDEVTGEAAADDGSVVQEVNGWRRVVTFLPDGTCREEFARLVLREPGLRPVAINVRGLTGITSTETLALEGR